MSNKYLFLLSRTYSANGICVKNVIQKMPCLKNIYVIMYDDGVPKDDIGINIATIPHRSFETIISRAITQECGRVFTLILQVIRRLLSCALLPIWPTQSFKEIYHYYKQASRIIKAHKITHVIAVCYPGETLLALCFLKMRFGKKIKTIMYPLDVFVCGKYDGFAIEKKMSSFFSLIFSNICAFFSDKIIVLENAIDCYEKKLKHHKHKFEICGLPLIYKYEPVNRIQKRESIHFVYGGNIIKSIRNPDYLFKILNDYCCLMNENICIDIYGSINKQLLNDFILKYNSIKFNYFGWVSEEDLSNAICDANAVISVGNSVGHLIPSKIFKYMSLKKPIIHLNFIDADPCLPYLKKYGHTFFVENGVDVDLDDFRLWLKSLESCEISVDCEKLFPQCTPAYTANVIQSC